MALVASIGRNVDGEPMPPEQWAAFQADLDIIMRRHCRELFFQGQGQGQSEPWGFEQAYTVVGDDLPSWAVYSDLVAELEALREEYGQDAIALTQGHTTFV